LRLDEAFGGCKECVRIVIQDEALISCRIDFVTVGARKDEADGLRASLKVEPF
jgi:hypothetical protein